MLMEGKLIKSRLLSHKEEICITGTLNFQRSNLFKYSSYLPKYIILTFASSNLCKLRPYTSLHILSHTHLGKRHALLVCCTFLNSFQNQFIDISLFNEEMLSSADKTVSAATCPLPPPLLTSSSLLVLLG